MPVTPIRGVGGKVMVGLTDFTIIDWTMTKTSRLTDITHSGSGGYAEWFPGVTEATGSFNAVWDLTNMPDAGNTANSPAGADGSDSSGSLEVGKLVTLKLYVGESGKFYSIPSRIESLAVTVNAQNDVVKFACNFKSSGTITDPVA